MQLSSSLDVKGEAVNEVLVGVILGSDADLPAMEAALRGLERFGVSFEVKFLSAHRTPHQIARYAESARGRGIRVLIVGAGAAGHAAGAIAGYTNLPVVGVPLSFRPWTGIEALQGMTCLPPGIVVGTVGIDAAHNAAIYAIQILSISNPSLVQKLDAYRLSWVLQYDERNMAISESGYKDYKRTNFKK